MDENTYLKAIASQETGYALVLERLKGQDRIMEERHRENSLRLLSLLQTHERHAESIAELEAWQKAHDAACAAAKGEAGRQQALTRRYISLAFLMLAILNMVVAFLVKTK